MPSPLSFAATQNFRNDLLVRNLTPYTVPGSFSPINTNQGTASVILITSSVLDSPSVEIIGDAQERDLYKLNRYGPGLTNNGFGDTVIINQNNILASNLGPYRSFSSQPNRTSDQSQTDAFLQNVYGPEGGYGDLIDIVNIQRNISTREAYYKFVASRYNPAQILLQQDPTGTNGLLSQDSALAQIGAQTLRNEFINRVAQETYQQTLGRANAFDNSADAFDLLGIAVGARSIIEPDWHISVPDTLIGKSLDFISRVTGIYAPYSWIPGDYFRLEPKISGLNQAINNIASVFGATKKLLPEKKTGSDIFLANTGGGQKSRLFKNISYSKFRPDYKTNFISELNLLAPVGNYYIGSRANDLSNILYPQDELPKDEYGNNIQMAVRDYTEMGKLYEGPEKDFQFGLNTSAAIDGFGVQGGFTWVSPKFKGNAGFKVGKGAEVYGQDTDFDGISAQYNRTESTNYDFTRGSILDDTQRIIEAVPNNGGRLYHVGNAIDQVSKVFNDGYKEMTKGSRVIKYVDENGAIRGEEYCRVFTKDTPYYTFNDLQKTDGNIRKFTNSVLDSTFNLNITPNSREGGQDSSNLVGGENGNAKKYMFSIENLAWRTSNKPGFTVNDLPISERGPNGGRVMWFPPYDISFDETNTARWDENVFLGRPEPIYTYNSTKRSGSLSWKIVVDHPSILNVIVNKILTKPQSQQELNAIVESFMAGCLKYDIYELAQRFPSFSRKELEEILSETKNLNDVAPEFQNSQTGVDGNASQNNAASGFNPILQNFQNLSFYFDENVPNGGAGVNTTSESFDTAFSSYKSEKGSYEAQNGTGSTQIGDFFTTNISDQKFNSYVSEFLPKLYEDLEQNVTVTLTLLGQTDNTASPAANVSISKRRIEAVKNFILNYSFGDNKKISKYADRLRFEDNPIGATSTNESGVGCDTTTSGQYNISSVGCRRVVITKINESPNPSNPQQEEEEAQNSPRTQTRQSNAGGTTNSTSVQQTTNPNYTNLAKKILKRLLNESDYFQVMKSENPMVYDSLKDKLKFFQPAFHSMTPEGLNSRLTFLNQCIRPGDTIPTIGPNGELIQNDAINTSFGAPPVCVLRIGDFYHSKIVINSISFRYDPLVFDINPEGIGVQPMIADVQLNFDFIGGQGLAAPIQKLQNALSFNYYANTEMYDDRAEVTEDTSVFDKQVYNSLVSQGLIGPPTTQSSNDAGVTIGDIKTTRTSETGQTGTISYKQRMDDLVDLTKKYTDSVVNKLESINGSYNYGVLMISTSERNYQNGKIMQFGGNSFDTNLYGKSDKIQSKLDDIFRDAISDVDNDSSPLIKFVKPKNLTESGKKQFKEQMKSKIAAKKNNFLTEISTATNEITKSQLELINLMSKLDFVATNTSVSPASLFDGYVKDNKPNIYALTGTTGVTQPATQSTTDLELKEDYLTVGTDLKDFYDNLGTSGIIQTGSFAISSLNTFSTDINTDADKRFYIIFSNEILSNTQEFITSVLGNLSQFNTWTDEVTAGTNELKNYYQVSKDDSIQIFEEFRTGYYEPNWGTYLPYPLGKTRDFDYGTVSSPTNEVKTRFTNIYKTTNLNNDKTSFLGKKVFN